MGTLAERGQSLFGLGVFILLTFVVGRMLGARKIPWRVIIWGIVLQFAFGAIVLYAPYVLENVQLAIDQLLKCTVAGANMVFGNLAGESLPVVDPTGRQIGVANHFAVFGFVVLPTIIFVSMLTAMLYHLGVLTWVVKGLASVMQRTMGTSGAETLSTAANIFVGQTEAPLLVRPFLLTATRSELMAIMVGGFSNIASGVLVAYTRFLGPYIENVGGHLAAACFISAPATLIVAKLLMPETEKPQTASGVGVKVEKPDSNLFDAATRGTSEGLLLAINVGAMLIAFTALVALVNVIIGWAFGQVGVQGASLERGLGYLCAPIAWLCGVPWSECREVGALLGIKTVLNEFIAYLKMSGSFAENPSFLSPRAALLATYALCGFANIASVGIQIGGISVLAPERRHDLSRIGFLAMLGGAIASCMGACVVGVLL
ncbi:MAG: NupC/NupG family nucleoside CNT transporter [Burkholderiales bacterium]|nr:NupC/NupG family nucleoside CNT transporter [Phycisphaerae bacterium]